MILFVFYKETWILYRGNEHGVSKVVREAYENYGDMEFGKKNRAMHDPPKKNGIPLDDASRHIKLISIAGKEVIVVNIHTKSHRGLKFN